MRLLLFLVCAAAGEAISAPLPTPAASDSSSGAVLALVLIGAVLVLCVVVAWILAPFMLYGIHSRLGETNELLRYIAHQVRAAQGQPDVQTPQAQPIPSGSTPSFTLLR